MAEGPCDCPCHEWERARGAPRIHHSVPLRPQVIEEAHKKRVVHTAQPSRWGVLFFVLIVSALFFAAGFFCAVGVAAGH